MPAQRRPPRSVRLLLVLGARGTLLRIVRPAAWLLGPVSIALMALTVLMAVRSY